MTIKYCILQGLYWTLFCAGGGFVTAYLVEIGVEAAAVGTMTALFCGASALLQPVLGRKADKGGKWEWNNQLFVLYGLVLLCNVGLLLQRNHLLSCILFGIIILCMNCAMPFVNGAGFYYENRGIPVNFGIARGMGSLSYAVLSFFLGSLMEQMGIQAVSGAGLILSIISILALLMFPSGDEVGVSKNTSKELELSEMETREKNKAISFGAFVKKYPAFMCTLVGFSLLLMFHNLANTYLLQMIKRVGGSSSELGVTLSIAAALELPIMFAFSILAKKFPIRKLLIFSGIMFSFKSVAYLLATNVMGIYLTQLLQPFSYAVFASASVYYAQELMDEENKLRGQSLVTSAITLGAVFGNLIGGFVLQLSGVITMLYVGVAMAVLGAIVVLVLNGPWHSATTKS